MRGLLIAVLISVTFGLLEMATAQNEVETCAVSMAYCNWTCQGSLTDVGTWGGIKVWRCHSHQSTCEWSDPHEFACCADAEGCYYYED